MSSGNQPYAADGTDKVDEHLRAEEGLIDAIGEVIAHWGFKKNHGRIWTFLFLQECPLSSSEIRLELGLSKGAASMLLNDLEEWNIVLREGGERQRKYRANDELLTMISNVFQTRENALLRKVSSLLMQVSAQQKEGQLTAKAERINKLQEFTQVAQLFVALVNHLKTHPTAELLQLVNQLTINSTSAANVSK